jgi:hypothetical protein
MTDPIELPLDDEDRLADPPLLDLLHYEESSSGYSVTFVPSCDDDPTHFVLICLDSVDGKQVSAYLDRIAELVGGRVTKVIHAGGGDYTLHLADGRITALSDGHAWTMEVFDRLKQVANVAEAAYLIAHVAGR